MTSRRTKIYFDGGCRPNPGPMEIAVVTGGVAAIDRDIGVGSNLDAEWLALIAALRLARVRGGSAFEVGRASCRERVCVDVSFSVGAVPFKQNAQNPNECENCIHIGCGSKHH